MKQPWVYMCSPSRSPLPSKHFLFAEGSMMSEIQIAFNKCLPNFIPDRMPKIKNTFLILKSSNKCFRRYSLKHCFLKCGKRWYSQIIPGGSEEDIEQQKRKWDLKKKKNQNTKVHAVAWHSPSITPSSSSLVCNLEVFLHTCSRSWLFIQRSSV